MKAIAGLALIFCGCVYTASAAAVASVQPLASAAQPAAEQRATAEQENLFWQSIMNSTNPADFEAYLEEFPNGVFRRLAQNRLAALRSPAAGSDRMCAGQPAGTACWMEITGQPGCYVWNSGLAVGATVTWTGGCTGDRAQGAGSLTWVWDGNERVDTGRLQAGEMTGHWVFRFSNGFVQEGPIVDGKENGHWVLRFPDGSVQEGLAVDGEQHGEWVIRDASGDVEIQRYENGELVETR